MLDTRHKICRDPLAPFHLDTDINLISGKWLSIGCHVMYHALPNNLITIKMTQI